MPAEYSLEYIAVLIATIVGVVLVLFSFAMSFLLAPRSKSEAKNTPYECGIPPLGRFWSQMHLRYYIFGILFLIFDVEAAFLFPWAIIFKSGGAVLFYEMILFIAILFFGLIYGWKKGILQWK
ncbi:MAG: NADH-quinone oxidoreductase subunit A [Dehalococcoidia bacterium]